MFQIWVQYTAVLGIHLQVDFQSAAVNIKEVKYSDAILPP